MEMDNRVIFLIPEITSRVRSKLIVMWTMSRKTLADFVQPSRERMGRENEELYKVLERYGEEEVVGGSLGYFLLRIQEVRGSAKIPTITLVGINSRLNSPMTMAAIQEELDFTDKTDLARLEELAQQTESISPQQAIDYDKRYFRTVAEIIMSDERTDEKQKQRMVFGAVAVHDLLRHQADINRVSALIGN